MHFTIIGAGALGTILATHLVRAKHEVACVVRERRGRQLRENGLQLVGLKEFEAQCEIITNPADISRTDVLVIATKTYQTASAVETLNHVEAGNVFSMANGVKKNEQLQSVFEPDTVVGCMANVSGELLENGIVNYTRNVCLHLGALAPHQRPAVQKIAQAIDDAGIVCQACDNIQTIEWSKYVGWVAFMCLAVVTRARTGDFLLDKNHARLAVRLIKEMAEIAAHKNIPLVDQSPMPVKTIAENDMQTAIQAVLKMGKEFNDAAPNHRMSALQDLERGAVLEHEDTLGFALELARAMNSPAPTIEDCYDLVSGINAINQKR